MTCDDVIQNLATFVDNQLDPEHYAQIERHAASCFECRQRIDEERAFSAELGAQIRSVGLSIQPPVGGKEKLLAALNCQPVAPPVRSVKVGSFNILAWSCAALLALGCGYAWFHSQHNNVIVADPDPMLKRYEELTALRQWQNELAESATKCGKDPALLSVACAYLPPEQRTQLLQRTGETPSSLAQEWNEKPEQVVHLQRATRKGDVQTELTFEQWSDGRVHVEHSSKKGDDATVTKLDAGTWEILAAQNPELCRQLEIVDDHGNLLVGLPLPSAAALKQETFAALNGRATPADLVKRLLQLRLAKQVKSRAELDSSLIVENSSTPLARPSPQTLPGESPADVRKKIEELERITSSGMKTIPNVAESSAYFRKLCSF